MQALPHGYRARAFGVMQGGLQLIQGGAVLVTGLLADHSPLPLVVGVWSVGGVVADGARRAAGRAAAFADAIAASGRGRPTRRRRPRRDRQRRPSRRGRGRAPPARAGRTAGTPDADGDDGRPAPDLARWQR